MLYIGREFYVQDAPHHQVALWNVGEKFPEEALAERVVILQADGDELDILVEAIRSASAKEVKQK